MSKRLRKTPPTARGRAPSSAAEVPVAGRHSYAWLTRLALAIAVVVVIARLFMSETVRPVGVVAPGGPVAPAMPGPAAGLPLDLLAGLCPLLVLARRWRDPAFRLRSAWSPVLFVALAGWAVASTLWATDRFAAVVSSFHLLSAAGVLWAVAQSADGWRDLWLTAGLCAGLLAVLLTHGLWYEWVDRPELKREFERNPDFVREVQDVRPGEFGHTQLVNGILRGELRGFSLSPNTYAAQLVLLGLATVGTAAACGRRRRWVVAGVAALLVVGAGCVLPLTQSRTGYLTAAGGLALLSSLIGLSAWSVAAGAVTAALRRRARPLYLLGAVAVFAPIAFVVWYGVSHGTLFHDSLNFRWRYWSASFDLWRLRPLAGVGWENFGPHYLGVRGPEATEEIKDPHNFLVRYAAELGLVGLGLAVAWTAVIWWEVTRPVEPMGNVGGERVAARWVAGFAGTLGVGMVLNVVAAVDVSHPNTSYVVFEAFRRVVYGGVLLGVVGVVVIRARGGRGVLGETASGLGDGASELAVDGAPAPWLLAGLLSGLGMFFVHSLVDFAMFEPGPMFLVALLLGAAVGVRFPRADVDQSTRPARRGVGGIGLACAGAAWAAGALLVVIPVCSAEAEARRADDALRASLTNGAPYPARARAAAAGYESALRATVPNADYAVRAAVAWAQYVGDQARGRAMADAAVAADPADVRARVVRAELLSDAQPPDSGGAAADLAEAVRLDPINRPTRVRYGKLLERLGRAAEASQQYETALALNERLTPVEKRRFTPDEVAQVKRAIERVKGGASGSPTP